MLSVACALLFPLTGLTCAQEAYPLPKGARAVGFQMTVLPGQQGPVVARLIIGGQGVQALAG